jgi:gliding motility-associated-like protein
MIKRELYVGLVWFVSFFGTNCLALDPPNISCISLDSNDNLILNWTIPTDTSGSFSAYIVYYQDGTGNPFQSNTTITNYNQTQVTLTGNFAGDAAFFMVTTSNGGLDVSLSSDTLKPLLINLGVEENLVEINWKDLDLSSPDSIYRLYRSINNDDFVFSGSSEFGVGKLFDMVEYCEANASYRIEIMGDQGCTSVSNVANTSVLDQIAPKQTNLICASVDTSSGAVDLAWDRTESEDGFGYLISHQYDFIGLDTIWGRNNLTYTYDKLPINAMFQPETLSVAPFDSCFDSQTSWYNQAADSLRFSTLFIDSIYFDRCAGEIGLKWNMPKDGYPVGVRFPSEYQVFRRQNGGASIYRGSVNSGDSVFIDSGLVKGSRYEFNVAVLDGVHLKRAISNTFSLKIKAPVKPDPLYISSIINDHENSNNVVFVHSDTTSETVEYGLFRSPFFDGPFQLVANSNRKFKANFNIVDLTSDADHTGYAYKLIAFDYCGDSIQASETALSSWIGGYSNDQDFVNQIEWSGYEGFVNAESSLGLRQIVRLTNEVDRDTILEKNAQFSLLDTVHNLDVVDGQICYYLEDIESDTNKFGLLGISRSNLLCFDYEPKVFIPSAFTPDNDGLNDVFIPDVNFVETTGYTLSIYDRKGNLIYITIDPSEGWTGEGSPVGVYAYFLELKNARNEEVNYRGRISLLR